MSNTKYTAADPPGGKIHDVAKNDAAANRLPPEEPAGSDYQNEGGKTATSPKTVANSEK